MNYNCWALQYYLFQKKKEKKQNLQSYLLKFHLYLKIEKQMSSSMKLKNSIIIFLVKNREFSFTYNRSNNILTLFSKYSFSAFPTWSLYSYHLVLSLGFFFFQVESKELEAIPGEQSIQVNLFHLEHRTKRKLKHRITLAWKNHLILQLANIFTGPH